MGSDLRGKMSEEVYVLGRCHYVLLGAVQIIELVELYQYLNTCRLVFYRIPEMKGMPVEEYL